MRVCIHRKNRNLQVTLMESCAKHVNNMKLNLVASRRNLLNCGMASASVAAMVTCKLAAGLCARSLNLWQTFAAPFRSPKVGSMEKM